MKKVKSFQASDGQLFLDGGKLVTHELKQVIVKEIPNDSEAADKIAAALAKNHATLFDALKLLRAPATRKSKTTTTAPGSADKRK